MYADDEDSNIKGTFEIYKAEADSLFKQGEFRKAIESYTTALELQDKDKNCLVARSKCHLHLGDTKNALEDAESSLVGDGFFHKGIYQKAQSLYYQGDFEMALVFYHRGHRIRPELSEFRLGIQKAQEAIDNAVGAPERVKLSTIGDLSYFDKLQNAKRKPTLQSFTTTSQKQEQKRQERMYVSSEKTVKQLLGELYEDKQYLEKLLKLSGPNSKGNLMSTMAQDGLAYLSSRTEFWRQQNPMYARKQDRLILKRSANISAGDFVIREIEFLDKSLTDGRFNEVIKRAHHCIAIVETFSDSELLNKSEVIANLHSFLGNAYLESMAYTKAIKHHRIDHEMGVKYRIDTAVSRALDNIGRAHARNKEYAKAIAVWEQKLPLTRSTIESTWLYHEIGRCYLECGEFAKAEEFGEMSIKTADDIKDAMWQLQAHVLVAQAQMKQNKISGALGSFTEALKQAKSQGDESAELALIRAIEELSVKTKSETEPNTQQIADSAI